MKIAITGHANIEAALGLKLVDQHGTQYNLEAYNKVSSDIMNALLSICEEKQIQLNELTLISGMARGVDELFAILAIQLNIPLILSIPGSIKWHRNRSLSRGIRAQAIYYDYILSQPNLVGNYEIGKDYKNENFPLVNLARNQHMVDIADIVISYRISDYDSTGTNDCIDRARFQNKYYGNVIDIIKGDGK